MHFYCCLFSNQFSLSSIHYTDGLIWVSKWSSLQHPVASAFLAALYSDYMVTSKADKLNCDSDSFSPEDIRNFAKSQVSIHYQ